MPTDQQSAPTTEGQLKPPGSDTDGTNGSPPAPAPRANDSAPREDPKEYQYLVYEATDVDKDGVAQVLAYVATVTARDKNAARWEAVDVSDELGTKTQPKAKGAHLLAIPVRTGKPVMTKEDVVEHRVRK